MSLRARRRAVVLTISLRFSFPFTTIIVVLSSIPLDKGRG
jgi:hypothetical protein